MSKEKKKGNKPSTVKMASTGVGGLVVGGAIAGNLAWGMARSKSDELESESSANEIVDAAEASVGSSSVNSAESNAVSTSEAVNDEMTFDEAFEAAREELGAGGVFEWNGNTYGTYYQDEWDALSDEQKAEYWESVNEAGVEVEDEVVADTEAEVEEAFEVDNVAPESGTEEGIEAKEDVFKDLDEDGYEESRYTDSDGDGKYDQIHRDTNNDGEVDMITSDTDGDGISDHTVRDMDGDGYFESQVVDSDGDGTNDQLQQDWFQDGNVDRIITDTDGDGKTDHVLDDTTGDGHFDAEFYTDAEGNITEIVRDEEGQYEVAPEYATQDTDEPSSGEETDSVNEADEISDRSEEEMVGPVSPSSNDEVYEGEVKEIDKNNDGTPDRRETYDEEGNLIRVEDSDPDHSHYTRDAIDTDGDGEIDTVYVDTDDDGETDMIETRPGSEATVGPVNREEYEAPCEDGSCNDEEELTDDSMDDIGDSLF
jgi:hypothetical protein